MPKRAIVSEAEPELEKKGRTNIEHVSGTDVRNYLLNDPLVDWLKLYYKTPPSTSGAIFHDYIMKAGIAFEEKVIKQLREYLPVVTVSGNGITPERCEKTRQFIEQRVPAIHSGCFKSDTLGLKGITDLLIRSDLLPMLGVNDFKPEISTPYYVVIDIKFSTLPLRANGKNILNSGKYPAYKGQLYIYNQCLGEVQGFLPSKAYLMGRRWRYISKGEVFSERTGRLGEVDFSGVDISYVKRTENAIQWINRVRTEGSSWSVNPPTVSELYPNMCIDSYEWNSTKRKIALENREITLLWYCGVKQRNIAHSKGIFTWDNPKCNSYNLEMGGSRGKVLNAILKINKSKTRSVSPLKIKNNIYDWKTPCNEMFVDFETFCDIDDTAFNGIFMIGVWYQGKYTNFVAETATYDGELKIMRDFIKFVRDNNDPALWYWYADANIWTRSENNQMDRLCVEGRIADCDDIADNWRNLYWCDMSEIFRSEPVTIKGCFKFGLKEIAEALKVHGHIQTSLTSLCKNGLDAAIMAKKVYDTRITRRGLTILKDIAEYNRFDVEVLSDILRFLRTLS